MAIEVSGVAATTEQKASIRAGIGATTHHGTVANEAAMVALTTAVVGSMCTRSDFTPPRLFVLATGTYEVAANWLDIGTADGSTVRQNIGATTYSLTDNDFGADGTAKTKVSDQLSGCLVTIPTTLTGEAGEVCEIQQKVGTAQVTVQAGVGVTLTTLDGSTVAKSAGENAIIYLIRTAEDTYYATGELLPTMRSVPAADDQYAGTPISGRNAGATIAQWEAVYLDAAGAWQLADANGSGTFPARGLAVAAGSVAAGELLVLDDGIVRNDAWNWTVGATIWLSGTPGGLTQTKPVASGDNQQPIGYALSADSMRVLPSLDYQTVA